MGIVMNMQSKTSVGIADEITFLRTALRHSLSQQEGLQVIFDVPNTSDLFQKLTACRVDVLLLDAYLHPSNVREVILSIRTRFPLVKMLVLSLNVEYDVVSDLLDLGINGFLSKSAELDELVDAIHCASQSDIYKNKILTETFYWKAHNHLHRNERPEKIVLSETEKKIIQLLWEEKSTLEIAKTLFASVSTVEKLKQKIKRKIDTQSVVGMIKYGLKERIIPAKGVAQ